MTTEDEANPFAAPARDEVYAPVEGGDGVFPLASRAARFSGALLDGLVYMVPFIIGAFFINMDEIGFLAEDASDLEAFTAMGTGSFVMFAGFLGVAIYQMYLISTTGQSIGKKAVNTRIIREDGSPVDFVSGVVLRAWIIGVLGYIPILGNFIGLANVLFIFGQRRQCLHDMIAKTIVIDVTHGG